MTDPAIGTIHCPECAADSEAAMPSDACLFFYDCPACGARLKPKPGDCCVFCSYGATRCPFSAAPQPVVT